jgi:cell shape-determining protein MreC
MLTVLNPEFAEKQRQEQEIASLKGQMSEMSKNMADLMEMNKRLMEQLGTKETSKNSK